MIDITKVTSVYSGKKGMCCCGCAGTHYYPSHMHDKGMALRGYPIEPREINNRMVKRIVNIINRNPDKIEHSSYDNEFLCAVIGKRQYVAYFREI